MTDLRLNAAWVNYDRLRPLTNGTVSIEGVELNYSSVFAIGDTFERMIKNREFDVCEMGLTFYLRTLDRDDLIAIPVFPQRAFRHAAIFINRSSGIVEPKDLVGKRVGELLTYGHDAGIWSKGILSDEYGVPADSYSEYVVGGYDQPFPRLDWLPVLKPDSVTIRDAGPEKALGPMLADGEIDALFSGIAPTVFLRKHPNVGRLFENYETVEREYFQRTAIFPIMHCIVIRKDLWRKHPWLAERLYNAFNEAREHTMQGYRMGMAFSQQLIMIPWLPQLVDENRALMGDDWWPYGLRANHKAIDTFLRYHYEQGVSKRRLTPEEIFAPELLET